MALEDLGGFIEGYAGEEISLIVNGIKVMALQNFSWKASQKKEPIKGCGWGKPHGMGRGPVEYELSFEVKELNTAVLTVPGVLPPSEGELTKFKIGDMVYTSLLEIKNATILIVYPPKNGVIKIKKFKNFEFTDVEGGGAIDDVSVGTKCSGIALDAEGIL